MDQIQAFAENDRFAAHAGIRLLTVSPGYAKAEMRVQPYHMNGAGMLHGAAIFTLADFVFAAAANSYGTVAVAVNINISFIKAVKSGNLYAEAREASKNHKLGNYTVEVRDEEDDLIALFQGLAYRKKDKLN